jgi:hypothetical protein
MTFKNAMLWTILQVIILRHRVVGQTDKEMQPRVVVGASILKKQKLTIDNDIGGVTDMRCQSNEIVVAGTSGVIWIDSKTYKSINSISLNNGDPPYNTHTIVMAAKKPAFFCLKSPGDEAILYAEEGKVKWRCPAPHCDIARIGDVAGDAEPEFVLGGHKSIIVIDIKGVIIKNIALPNMLRSLLLVDVNNDSKQDIAYVAGEGLTVLSSSNWEVIFSYRPKDKWYVYDLGLFKCKQLGESPLFGLSSVAKDRTQKISLVDFKGQLARDAVGSDNCLPATAIAFGEEKEPLYAITYEMNQQGIIAGFSATRLRLLVLNKRLAVVYDEILACPKSNIAKGNGAIAALKLSDGRAADLLVGYGYGLWEYKVSLSESPNPNK